MSAVPYVMLFILQHTQNRDNIELHVKLDALIAATKRADNRVIGVDEWKEEEVRELAARLKELSK